MPLRLKSIELHGFKTFATKTNFSFPGMITAIVGPNGSGKSNITDGLRWVLGEQSYSLMRGKKTEDMIFSGSDGRSRAGMAMSTITFDNSDNWLPVDYSEVAITRRAYRDGQNEYLLNGQRVRLKDISELLSQSGLSERTYTVIGQGLVDASLALRPEERRKLFEEAAGIGLYRSRREESLNRMESTHHNIERVQDILAELEPRLGQLERQAKKAIEYERIKADLKLLLREWYGYHWFTSQNELTHQRNVVKSQEKLAEAARNKHTKSNTEVNDLRLSLQELRTKLNQWHSQSSTLHNEKEQVSLALAVIDERRRSILEQKHSLQVEADRILQESEFTANGISELEEEQKNISKDLNEASEKSSALKEKLDNLQREKASRDFALDDLKRKITQFETSNLQLQAQVDEKTNRRKTLVLSRENLEKVVSESSAQLESLQEQLRDIEEEKNKLEDEFQQYQAKAASIRKEQNGLAAQISDARNELMKLQRESAKLKIEIDAIKQAEINLTGYSVGAKQILTLIRQGNLKGLQNALSSGLIIPPEYEAAIAASLGDFLDAVIVEDDSDLESALQALDSSQNNRSAIIPSKGIHELKPISVSRSDGIVGCALELVQFPAQASRFYSILLAKTLIVKSRKDAREHLNSIPLDGRIVTLQGEVFYPNGAVIGGKVSGSSKISRPRQIQEMESLLAQTLKNANHLEGKIATLDDENELLNLSLQKIDKLISESQIKHRQVNTQYQQISFQEEKNRRQVDWNQSQIKQNEAESSLLETEILDANKKMVSFGQELQKLQQDISLFSNEDDLEEIEPLRSEYNFQQTSCAVNQRALDDLNKRLREKIEQQQNAEKIKVSVQNRLTLADEQLAQLEIARVEKTIAEDQKSIELQLLQDQIQPTEEEILKLEESYNTLQSIEDNSQMMLGNAEKHLTQAQMDLNYKIENLEVLRRRIEEDFGLVAFEYSEEVTGPNPLPIEGMVEELPKIEKLSPDLEESLTRQKVLLRRMGAVNPEAQTEYNTTKERFDFLKTQIADLHKAEEDLKKILGDLDELMKSEFHKTFGLVADEFPRMFNRLFGGGSARLVLTDPDNIHDTGIDINARLPGRREQELTLLSGGERSLTAVALIFALLKISPTPFCVLDEVDAALDETNVGRFRELLEELSKEIQFILVTHNRNTVQAANVIYGITMGRDSSSQMVSLRLDEVSDEMLKRSK